MLTVRVATFPTATQTPQLRAPIIQPGASLHLYRHLSRTIEGCTWDNVGLFQLSA